MLSESTPERRAIAFLSVIRPVRSSVALRGVAAQNNLDGGFVAVAARPVAPHRIS
jgi:hypothetical protein